MVFESFLPSNKKKTNKKTNKKRCQSWTPSGSAHDQHAFRKKTHWRQGFFLVSSGAEIRPLSQWDLGDFFPNLKKKSQSQKKKKKFFFFFLEFSFSHHTHTHSQAIGPILSWRLIMKLFLRSFSSLPLIHSRRVVVSLFCCFTSHVNSYGHCGTVSSLNHTFSWAGLSKRLTSNLCTYFRL